MNPKIGIMTPYYESKNYGGLLQAYALNRYIRSLGYSCETVQYDYRKSQSAESLLRKAIRVKGLLLSTILNRIVRKLRARLNARHQAAVDSVLENRRKRFAAFRDQMIPHSDAVYTPATIEQANGVYSAFIVGSDRVWMPKVSDSTVIKNYLLDFVEDTKVKMSYAASMGEAVLNPDQLRFFSEYLSRFHAISVREKSAQELLQGLLNPKYCVHWVNDPVFLLSPTEWSEVTTFADQNQRYIMVYSLNMVKQHKQLLESFAKTRGFPLVSIPYADGRFNPIDKAIDSQKQYDCGPADFISLIQHAEVVFTDSFHCAAFSLIFGKEFFVFDRDEASRSSGYLDRLLDLFDLAQIDQKRILRSSSTVADLNACPRIDYLTVEKRILLSIQKSKNFLNHALATNLYMDKESENED